MSPLATYSFLPWLRQGIAGQIASTPAAGTRASVAVKLQLKGTPLAGGAQLTRDIDRNVQLFGPGDVVGVDSRAIVRTEPRDWITNFEPNYMPQIEFYDEDFPWRYTPAAPDGSRLRLMPWIMLLVLEEDVEFTPGTNVAGKPLPYIDLTPAAKLPAPDGLWAWAHVHVNRTLAASDQEFTSSDMNAVMPRLQAILDENPDLAYSRIVCPRRLDENKAYHAFLVPALESGRIAGLGLPPPPAPQPATTCAWQAYPGKPAANSLPVYHRWYFRTGTQGDFEYLVRLLKPQRPDARVGVRDVDVRRPAEHLPQIAEFGGVLKLGGALRVPGAPEQTWPPSYPHPFQSALAAFVNLTDDYAALPAPAANAATAGTGLAPAVQTDRDPLITAPIYGRWHALTQRLLKDRAGAAVSPNDNWVHQLNLDPRHRLPAGFGTRVVQSNQEEYMKAAWDQVGDVLEANRRIRQAQLAKLVGSALYARDLRPLVASSPERALVLTAPVQRHVLTSGATVHHQRTQSLVPPVVTSAAMRRMSRPGGRLMRALPFDAEVRPDNLLTRIDDGEVSAAPPKETPPGVVTTDEVGDVLLPEDAPPAVIDLLRRWRLLVFLPLLLALLIVVLVLLLVGVAGAGAGWLAGAAVVAAALVALWRLLWRWSRAIAQSDVVRPAGLTVEAVDALPESPDFGLSEPGAGVTPTHGAGDSEQAARFKDALRDWHRLHAASVTTAAVPAPLKLGLRPIAGEVVGAIDPDVTVPLRIHAILTLPPRIVAQLDERFDEVMAYPRIDLPMYKPLAKLSDQLLLPNLHLVPPNSITLLETNQKFIEAYMVGANHEFAGELLWREYPTDQRGSYFRQFWDARTALPSGGASPEAEREKLYDIPELHRWRPASKLGDHDHRELPGDNEEELVLVIRGELLKKYPNAVIYAQKARWQFTSGQIDPGKERMLVEPTAEDEADPKKLYEKLRTPLYEAKVDPDITFFGFDLDRIEARGGTGTQPTDPAGWFFVIKERPGEPRFGFDIDRAAGETIQTVNDLTWDDAIPGGGPGDVVPAEALATIALAPLGADDDEKKDQHADDAKVVTATVSAARWAYLLYQAPVIVAVHAAEMLPADA